MNQWEALVEIVKSTPPRQRHRVALVAAVVIGLPAMASIGVAVAAWLH